MNSKPYSIWYSWKLSEDNRYRYIAFVVFECSSATVGSLRRDWWRTRERKNYRKPTLRVALFSRQYEIGSWDDDGYRTSTYCLNNNCIGQMTHRNHSCSISIDWLSSILRSFCSASTSFLSMLDLNSEISFPSSRISSASFPKLAINSV